MTCVINAISFTLIRVLLASINISSKEETLEMQCLPFANSDHSPNDTLAITTIKEWKGDLLISYTLFVDI